MRKRKPGPYWQREAAKQGETVASYMLGARLCNSVNDEVIRNEKGYFKHWSQLRRRKVK
jgi:hypothetical protein